jgi:hypothetical protein
METVSDAVNKLKSMRNSSHGFEKVTPDYTAAKSKFTVITDVLYRRTIPGRQTIYFADNDNGNNIDISNLTDEEGQPSIPAMKVMPMRS